MGARGLLARVEVIVGLVLSTSIAIAMSTAMGRRSGTVEFVVQDGGASSDEVRVIGRAAEIANSVKNSDCFREFLTSRKLIETNGHTPRQVADHLQGVSGKLPVSF